MMNDHDRDLILALAAGSLSDADAEVARARIAADPELASEFAAQTSAIERLATLSPESMTADERSSLRSELIARLNLEDAPVGAATGRPRRSLSWWQPVLGIAAAAVVVTAVVVLPGTLGGSDSADFSALETLPGSQTITTTAAESEAPTDVADDGGVDSAPVTAEVLAFEETDGSELLDATEGKTDVRSIEDALAHVETPTKYSTVDVASVKTCLDDLAASLPDGEKIVLMGVNERDNDVVVYLGIDPGTGVESVVTVSLPDCQLVDVDE